MTDKPTTDTTNYEKGYQKGWADAQEHLAKKFEKILSENANKCYEMDLEMGQIKKIINHAYAGFGAQINM